jgi:hypothetical protein
MAPYVCVVLQSNHQAGAGERIEDRVALRLIETADFHRARDAQFVAGDHAEEKGLEFVEAQVQHERSADDRFLFHDAQECAIDMPLGRMRRRAFPRGSAVNYSDAVGNFYRLICYGSAGRL